MRRYLIGIALALGLASSAQAQGTISLASLIGPDGTLPVAGVLLGGPNGSPLLGDLSSAIPFAANPGSTGNGLLGPLLSADGGPAIVGDLVSVVLGSKGGLPVVSTVMSTLPTVGNLLGADGGLPVIQTLIGTTGNLPVLGGVLSGVPVLDGLLAGGGQGLGMGELPLPLNDMDNFTLAGLLGGTTLPGL